MSKTTTYLCSYRFRDAEYSIEIPAETHAEAYLRLQAIGSSGQVDGLLISTIRVPMGGLIARIITFLRGGS